MKKPAQIQPKSQFLFHKNLPPRDFSKMTLTLTCLVSGWNLFSLILSQFPRAF